MTKRCELCTAGARLHCDSDQASLCWDCDAKVHSANFLVARHSRSLLCHVCQRPTAWSASGAELGRTVTVCKNCVNKCSGLKKVNGGLEEEREERDYDKIDTEGDDCDEDDEDDEDLNDVEDENNSEEEEDVSGDDDEDEDNQVVPWTWPSPSPPLPHPASSSSSGDESSSTINDSGGAFSLKRFRDRTADSHTDEDLGCSSSYRSSISWPATEVAEAGDSGTACVDSLNRSKRLRTQSDPVHSVQRGPPNSRTSSVIDSLERLYEQDVTSDDNAAVVIAGICELSKSSATVVSSSSKVP